MSWLPRLDIISGLLHGLTPFGSLDGAPIYVDDNLHETGISLSGTKSYYQDPYTHEGLVTWAGAYGSDSKGIMGAVRPDEGVTTELLLAEIPVKLPTGATFYKHTINFYGTGYYTEATTQDFDYEVWQFNLSKVTRKMYADPNTPYVETVLGTSQASEAITVYWLLNGDREDFDGNLLMRLLTGFGFFTYDSVDYFGAFMYANSETPSLEVEATGGSLMGLTVEMLSEAFGVDFEEEGLEEIDDPYEEDPPEDGPGKGGGGGGNGDHTLPNDPINIPDKPHIGAASVRWLTVYEMDQADISEFGEELVQPTAWQAVMSMFTNPLDSIVGIMLEPVSAPIHGTKTPKVSGVVSYTWSRSFDYIDNEFVDVDCGSIPLKPYYDSAFDFSPYTRLTLFLPFVGYRDIAVDECMGGHIGVKYRLDVLTGDCIAFVTRSATQDDFYGKMPTQVIAQFQGNCGVRVPIGRVSYDSAVNGALQLMMGAAGVAGGVAMLAASSGGLVSGGKQIAQSMLANQVGGSSMNAVNAGKVNIQRSGNLGAAAGYMGVLKPYIIRQIPRESLPDFYKNLEGYPCNKGGRLAMYLGSGLNMVETIRLEGIAAYDRELEEIENLVKGGVII